MFIKTRKIRSEFLNLAFCCVLLWEKRKSRMMFTKHIHTCLLVGWRTFRRLVSGFLRKQDTISWTKFWRIENEMKYKSFKPMDSFYYLFQIARRQWTRWLFRSFCAGVQFWSRFFLQLNLIIFLRRFLRQKGIGCHFPSEQNCLDELF